MTNMQAAIGCAQFEQIDKFLQRKLDMATMYNEGLKDLPLQLPYIEPWAKSSVWMYAVLLKDPVPFNAAEFAKRLSTLGVQTRPFFLGMHAQPVYLDRGLIEHFNCPITDKIYQRGLYMPSGQAITNDQIVAVIAAVRKVLS